MVGLGGVARLEGKYQEAKTLYDQVLDRNPDYPAAIVGAADVRWLMGNREGAVAFYRRIAPGNPFHSHAQRRIEEFENKGGTPAADGKPEAPKLAEEKKEAAPSDGTPKADEPKAEAPKVEAPKSETSKPDAPKLDAPKSGGSDEGEGQ
jgi:hypothetical protein